MKCHRFAYFLLPVVLFLVVLACNASNAGRLAGTAGPESGDTPAAYATYDTGQVIQVGDHTIVMNSYAIEGNILRANFTIENNGTKDVAVGALVSFEARDDNAERLAASIFDCGSAILTGNILPGDKLKGDLCWQASGAAPYKIYYRANLFVSGAIVWVLE